MIDRIDTMCLTVSDVEASCSWYEQVLGFEVAFKDEGYRVLSIGKDSVPLTIEEGKVSSNTSSYPIFFSQDIKKTYNNNLKGKGVSISELHIDGVNHFFDFYDPDQNRLQVCFFE
ncbi:VOC family protein [Halobacillus massiliensis]|uniref:VOC family protein n=1 Tax=Halobacillus massiliensis TaxID=1926286 RepID=UPI0009E2DA06|nr:VOC family protein [Halobacillus massiliensis]